MDGIIKIKNEGFSEYEQVLIERDTLKKEALAIHREYLRTFGDLMVKVFQKQVDCIKKKSMISFCLSAINRGTIVDQKELSEFIDKETKVFNEELKDLVDETKEVKKFKSGNLVDVAKVKKLYRKLAKLIHPDINPKTNENEHLKELWMMVVIYYNCNDLKGLEEAEVLINKALQDLNLETNEIEIFDLEEKIKEVKKEILQIKTSNPYLYKFLLNNKEALIAKENELQKELLEFENYDKELETNIVEIIKMGGVDLTWTN